MLSKLLLAALFFAAPTCSYTQDTATEVTENEPKEPIKTANHSSADLSETDKPESDVKRLEPPGENVASGKPAVPTFPIDYVRPNAKKRFKNYLDNVAGPASLTFYAGTAGLLTLRNSPKEWGAKSDGFGRRFANVAGKSLIRNTTIYGLDEALKLDSTFYRSRDRSVMARVRNSVFSAVTARDRRGKRVIGIPRIAGGVVSSVTASSVWYPPRYDYVHGLKGGAISLGIAAGMNLFKEFVWK